MNKPANPGRYLTICNWSQEFVVADYDDDHWYFDKGTDSEEMVHWSEPHAPVRWGSLGDWKSSNIVICNATDINYDPYDI